MPRRSSAAPEVLATTTKPSAQGAPSTPLLRPDSSPATVLGRGTRGHIADFMAGIGLAVRQCEYPLAGREPGQPGRLLRRTARARQRLRA